MSTVCGYLITPLRKSPSGSAHNAGFSTFTSPTKRLINCNQGKIACETSLPQPCDIHFISSLLRALSKMLTWLIRPMNCPAWGSCFARSSVRPTINSPPPVEHQLTVTFHCLNLYKTIFYLLLVRRKLHIFFTARREIK